MDLPYITIDSSIKPLMSDLLQVHMLEADERLSTPFRIVLEASQPDYVADLGSWLQQKVGIYFGYEDQSKPGRWFHGMVVAVDFMGPDESGFRYRVELAPKFTLSRHNRRTRVFRDKTAFDVVKQVLGDCGVDFDLKARDAEQMAHITQFEESDFAFVSRLLEQEGAAYWFTHAKSAHKMVIADLGSHTPAQEISDANLASDYWGITSLVDRCEIVPKGVVVRDYSSQHPKTSAEGQNTKGAKAKGAVNTYEEADYHITTSDDHAQQYARILADAQACQSHIVTGASTVHVFRSGMRVMAAFSNGMHDRKEDVMLTEVHHRLTAEGGYSNTFKAILISLLPWRPARVTPLPRIDGVIPGIISATAGDQGDDTQDGSYNVDILHGNTGSGTNTRVVRMAQPYAGPAQGIHFPLPVNTEVLLSHEYGHPDRPVITGAMINAEDPSPVVEENKTQCVIKSAAGAILVFEDKKDEEKTTLQSKGTSKLELDDKPKEEKVTLQSKALHKLEFYDKPGEELITLQSKALHKLLFDDKSGDEKITLQSKALNKLAFSDKAGEEKVSLQSKALHTLEFDDKAGSEKVTLVTKGKQKLEFLDASGSEKVSLIANKDHEVTVGATSKTKVKGKTTIDCEDEVEISAKTKITLKVGAHKIVISDGGIEISTTSDIKLDAKGKVTIGGTTGANISAQAGDVAVSGLNVNVTAQISAAVKGNASAELSASGPTTVKGAMVMIN